MARQKFIHFVPRPKPRKRPGRHTKNLNKSKKRSYKKYNRQGRWQASQNILVFGYERKNYNYKNKPNISTTILNIVIRVKYNEETMEVLRCRYTTVGS